VTGRDVYLSASIQGADKKAEDKLAEFRTRCSRYQHDDRTLRGTGVPPRRRCRCPCHH